MATSKKDYPTYEERIQAADQKIAQLTKLNNSRRHLVEITAQKLADRQKALTKSEEALKRVEAKKKHLEALLVRSQQEQKIKMTPEERAAARRAGLIKARSAKKAAKAEMDRVMEVLKAKGLTISDVISQLEANEGK